MNSYDNFTASPFQPPIYQGKDGFNEDKVRLFHDAYNAAYVCWNDFLPLANTDLQFYLGNQWSTDEMNALYQQGRNAWVFNRIKRNIDVVSGYQRKNRLSSVVIPIEGSSQKTADQLSKLLLYTMQYCNGYEIISDAFAGALKTGWNLVSVWMDYRDDPINGDIKLSRQPYNAFITDPYFFNADLSDCQYILNRKYLSLEETKALLPGHEKELDDLYHAGWSRDECFQWLPYQRMPSAQNMMAYNEMLVQKWKQVTLIVDKETGEYTEWEGSRDALKMFLSLHPNLTTTKKPKKYIEQNIIVNDVHIKTNKNPYGLDEYNLVPFLCTFEPESDDWGLKMQSLVRVAIDSQRESNRRRSQMIDVLESQINSGWIAEEDSVINPRSLFQSAQGKVIWKKRGVDPAMLQKIPAADIPQGMFQLQEMFERDMVEMMGLNDAAIGLIENANDSGILQMLRQGAAITNLQTVFDRLNYSQELISWKMLKLIQTWTPEKIEKIIGEKPTEEFYSKDFTKYKVAVQQGVLTDSQRQLYFRQLVEIQQLGAPVTPSMLAEAAPIQGKYEYIEQLKAMEQQQAEASQQQLELEQQLLASQQQMAQAKALNDIASAKERFTRAVANMGLEDERAAQAVENRADAVLQRAKALKELDSMDDDTFIKYMNIILELEAHNKAQEEQVKADDVIIAEESATPESATE